MRAPLLLLSLSVVTFSQDCKNKHTLCNFWAFSDECAKNPNYMLPNCPAACKQCEAEPEEIESLGDGSDSHKLCCFWAGLGMCDSNPYWMRVNCQKSCGTPGCSVENAESCAVSLNLDGCPWTGGQPATKAPKGKPKLTEDAVETPNKSNEESNKTPAPTPHLVTDGPKPAEPTGSAESDCVGGSPGTGPIAVQNYKRYLLELHNDLRRKIAKGEIKPFLQAANMHKLVWNDDLAEFARKHSALCDYMHTPISDRQPLAGFSFVGENLAVKTYSDWTEDWPKDCDKMFSALKENVDGWYNETDDFVFTPDDYSTATPTASRSTLHFTALAWAKTTEIGCSLALCPLPFGDGWPNYSKPPNPMYKFGSYLVCNYGEGGNIPNQGIFEQGPPCSGCSGGCEDGLCV